MAKAKIAVNGYGTIGKRVADAVRAQDDMEVIGISKTKPNYEASVAHQLGYEIYAPAENVGAFEKAGMPAAGTIEEMVEKADLVQYFTNWIRKSSSFIPISKYFSVKCLKS